jgi:hypothetical protein
LSYILRLPFLVPWHIISLELLVYWFALLLTKIKRLKLVYEPEWNHPSTYHGNLNPWRWALLSSWYHDRNWDLDENERNSKWKFNAFWKLISNFVTLGKFNAFWKLIQSENLMFLYMTLSLSSNPLIRVNKILHFPNYLTFI